MNAPNEAIRLESLPAAMAKAFAQIDGVVKGATNPHFKNRYADLSSVIEAIKPALVDHGLWFTQVTHEHERGIIVETVLWHQSGDHLSLGKLFVPATKADAQGFGSALTYSRRFALATAFGLRTFDDDAELARVAQERKPAPPAINPDRAIDLADKLYTVESLDELSELWKTLTPDERKAMAKTKDAVKDRFK